MKTQNSPTPQAIKIRKMAENLYTPNCIRTFTGIYMNVFEPTEDMICIEDIAHALAQQPRFGGHLKSFYSVAQHSLNCSYLCETTEDKYAALLHDASEAYLMDIPSPIKSSLSNYKEIEHNLMTLIAKKLEFQYPLSEAVKAADKTMLEVEWHHLMLGINENQMAKFDSYAAENRFLSLYRTLHIGFKHPDLTNTPTP